MKAEKMQTIYDALELTSVFSGVLKKPVFTAFVSVWIAKKLRCQMWVVNTGLV